MRLFHLPAGKRITGSKIIQSIGEGRTRFVDSWPWIIDIFRKLLYQRQIAW